jgi:GDP-L-fucose synthase
LSQLIADIVGYTGKICFDTSKPDGTPRKVLDVSRLDALGWKPRIAMADGICKVYSRVDTSGWSDGLKIWK